MKVIIITVAGMSSRFSQSLGTEVLKCIYYENSIQESLLYKMFQLHGEFDKYIIVGGYRYNELENVIEKHFAFKRGKIVLVYNPYFTKYGSGYSLYLGIRTALNYQPDEILFAEGDLNFDEASFSKVFSSSKSVITYNKEPITADKAVLMYIDIEKRIHYIFDTKHEALCISEPFIAIYNSGQVWKFADVELVRLLVDTLTEESWVGTNLVMIEKYFQRIEADERELIGFNSWINCNTINDYYRIRGEL